MVFKLTQEEGEFLVKLARKTVQEHLKTGKVVNVPKDTPAKLMQRCGVFVTINSLKNGKKKLKGCIGYPYPTTVLAQAVIECAISSATQDPRFSSLSSEELDKVIFEVSVLTPPKLVEVEDPRHLPSRIKIGKNGLIVERGFYKGLLLPQVPVEYNWDKEEFLCQCCIKAGLPPDNWLIKTTKIHKFQAIVFQEDTPRGKIKRKELGGR
ncbi:MAG: TIGR00296 family protein [Candidatus Bathyarchaeota archaeon]|nr:TIGR00296 family protein [Candidatus Bathyarchaeota archaeon]